MKYNIDNINCNNNYTSRVNNFGDICKSAYIVNSEFKDEISDRGESCPHHDYHRLRNDADDHDDDSFYHRIQCYNNDNKRKTNTK